MANGFTREFLRRMSDATGQSSPVLKVTPMGLVGLLANQSEPEVFRYNKPNGHTTEKTGGFPTASVYYRSRATVAQTDTSFSCTDVVLSPRQETQVTMSSTRQYAFYIDMETIAQYNDEASKMVTLNQSVPTTGVMKEIDDIIQAGANAILDGVNQDLWTIAAANIGINQRSGNNAAQTINFDLNGTQNNLSDGETLFLSDIYSANEVPQTSRMQVVGSGLWFNHAAQRNLLAVGPNQSGIDKSKLALWDFHNDIHAATALGVNQAIAYEPDAVKLVEYIRYSGFKAGELGTSINGHFKLPTMTAKGPRAIWFDFKLKAIDCPTTFTDAYTGATINADEGYQFIIRKESGLFTIPNDAYNNPGDRLSGNRGSYRYVATNV